MSQTCFVIGPIGDENSTIRDHADWLLDMIITPVFAEHFKAFVVVRSDRISSPGMIDSQVINHTLDADLVIADLSFQNPNVFYEMGLRHREQKPIIHMFLVGHELPFDVKPYRAIPFSLQHPRQLITAKDLLKKAVEAVLGKDYKVENPVTRARGYAELSKHAMPGQEVLLAEIESLRKEVQAVAALRAGPGGYLAGVSGVAGYSGAPTGVAPPRSWINSGRAGVGPPGIAVGPTGAVYAPDTLGYDDVEINGSKEDK